MGAAICAQIKSWVLKTSAVTDPGRFLLFGEAPA